MKARKVPTLIAPCITCQPPKPMMIVIAMPVKTIIQAFSAAFSTISRK